jgi:hypothetical protein
LIICKVFDGLSVGFRNGWRGGNGLDRLVHYYLSELNSRNIIEETRRYRTVSLRDDAWNWYGDLGEWFRLVVGG